MIIIKDVLASKDNWKRCLDKYYNYIKKHIGEDGCFDKTIKFKFKKSGDVYEMIISDFIVNLMVWHPFIRLKNITLDESYIFDCSNITTGVIKDYIDNQIIRRHRYDFDNVTLNKECAKIIENLKSIVEDFGVIFGLTINLYDLCRMRRISPEFKAVTSIEFPEGIQPYEVENTMKKAADTLQEQLTVHRNNFTPFIESKTGIKMNQLVEFLCVEGCKPDLDGNTIPVPINSNLCITGLKTPSDFTLDSFGGRKALIMNKKYTGKSGYFSRRLELLTMGTKLDPDPNSDCHSKHYLKFTIYNMDDLRRVEGRYFKYSPKSKMLHIVQITDTNLIGKTLYFRSPCKCAGVANGKGICHVCYGELANINNDINIGIFASSHIASRFIQNILSSKHLLKTNSTKIEFCKEFYDIFTLDTDLIYINSDNEKYKKYAIEIDKNNIESNVEFEMEYDVDGEISAWVESFRVINLNNKKAMPIIIKDKNDQIIQFTQYVAKLIDKHSKGNNDKVIIPLEDIDIEEPLFLVQIQNSELTKPLNMVSGLLEKKDHLGYDTIDDLIRALHDTLIESKIDTQLIHVEILVRELVRQESNILKYVDFSKEDIPPYKILTVKQALKYNTSPIVSLAFERVEEQLRRVLLFTKGGSSILDLLFLEHLGRD